MIEMSDEYFERILTKYIISQTRLDKVENTKKDLDILVKKWAGNCLNYTEITGSYAKGTATTLGSDFDLFISIINTDMNLREIFNSLAEFFKKGGYTIQKQNVSIGIKHDTLKVDLVPGKKQSGNTNDHSLYVSRKDTWTQTNVRTHVNTIVNSKRQKQIKIAKIWAKLHDLDFPSFYIEECVLHALKNRSTTDLDVPFQRYLKWLSNELLNVRFVDDANTNNVISDLVTKTEKRKIMKKAKEGYDAKEWDSVIW